MSQNNKDIDLMLSANDRFREQVQTIKEKAIAEAGTYLKSLGNDTQVSLESAKTQAKMNDNRVLIAARAVYMSAGRNLVSELRQDYAEQLNDLMSEVEKLQRMAIAFSSNLESAYEEQKNLRRTTRFLDIMLVLVGGGLSVLSLYPRPISITIGSLVILLIFVGARIWNELDSKKNLIRTKECLDYKDNLNDIYDGITKKKLRLGEALLKRES